MNLFDACAKIGGGTAAAASDATPPRRTVRRLTAVAAKGSAQQLQTVFRRRLDLSMASSRASALLFGIWWPISRQGRPADPDGQGGIRATRRRDCSADP